jgi:predicted transcriptional regulator YheO
MDAKSHLFETLQQIADTITQTFERHCEVAVHDLTNLNRSLVYITGDITRRRPGAPITDMVVKALRREGREIKDRCNYRTTTKDGRALKSSTAFIRDARGEVVAAFCINFDTTEYLNALQTIEHLVHTVDFNGNAKTETFAASVAETIEALFNQAVATAGKQPATMNMEEKIKLVVLLEEKGTFQIKGAVDQVALLLGVSKFTVYNYLQKVRAQQAVNKI